MRAVALFALPLLAYAGENPLEAIHALLAPMRTTHAQGLKTRGATPVFTDVKQRLRDWIESRVSVLNRDEGWTTASLQE